MDDCYHQSDFEQLPIENGYRMCPQGLYKYLSRIDKCKFAANSTFFLNSDGMVFPPGCEFGDSCGFTSALDPLPDSAAYEFGDGCTFGEVNMFAFTVHFGDSCVVDADCYFMSPVSMGNNCRIGRNVFFQDTVTTGHDCFFGKSTVFYGNAFFGKNIHFESLETTDKCFFEGPIWISNGKNIRYRRYKQRHDR